MRINIIEISNMQFVDDCICLSQNAIDSIYSMTIGFSSLTDELKCAFIDTIVDLSTRVMQSAETNKSLSQQAKNNTKAILYFLSAVTGKVEVAARTDGPSAPATKAATAAANDDSESEEEFTSKKTKASKSKAGKASAAPKGKGKKSASKGCFHWADYRGSLLELMVQAASMEASMLWYVPSLAAILSQTSNSSRPSLSPLIV